MSEFTVHYDDGQKAVFEHFDTRQQAVIRVLEKAAEGIIAIILEDWD